MGGGIGKIATFNHNYIYSMVLVNRHIDQPIYIVKDTSTYKTTLTKKRLMQTESIQCDSEPIHFTSHAGLLHIVGVHISVEVRIFVLM